MGIAWVILTALALVAEALIGQVEVQEVSGQRSVPEPTPAPLLRVPEVSPAPTPGGGLLLPTETPLPREQTIVDRFTEGYLEAGGNSVFLERLITVVIPCESGWQLTPVPTDPNNVFLGLLQFAPTTWAANARPGADWRDPYEQGWAGATLLNTIGGDAAGTPAGWPVCWW